MLNTIQGYYGSGNTPCDVFTYENNNGSTWYVVDGSLNVNCTYDDIELGVDVETLSDIDCFTWSSPIESESELTNAVES